MPLDDRATKVDAQTTDDAAAFLAAIVESSDVPSSAKACAA
nr:hypothetical protein [Ensifer adhaerens]